MQIFPRFFCFSTFRVLQTVFHLCIYVYMNRLLLHQFFLIHAMRHKQYIPLNILCCRVPVVYLPVRERYDIRRIARCYLHLPILSLPLVFVKCKWRPSDTNRAEEALSSKDVFYFADVSRSGTSRPLAPATDSAPLHYPISLDGLPATESYWHYSTLAVLGSWVILSVTSRSALCNYNITRFGFCQQSP